MVWQGAQSCFLGRGEVVIELGAPRRWRWGRRLGALRRWRRWRRLGAPRRWRRWRLQQRRRRGRRRRRGSLAKSREASPPVIDSCRKASPDGEAEGHSDHRGQSGCSPRSLVEKGRRNGIIGAPGEVGDEIDALRVDGASHISHAHSHHGSRAANAYPSQFVPWFVPTASPTETLFVPRKVCFLVTGPCTGSTAQTVCPNSVRYTLFVPTAHTHERHREGHPNHPTSLIPRNLPHITRPPGQARVSSDNTAAPGKHTQMEGISPPLGPFLLHVVLSTPAFSCFAERALLHGPVPPSQSGCDPCHRLIRTTCGI